MDHTFDTPDPIELYVELGKGRIDVTATDTDTTSVTVSGDHADEVVVEQRDGQVAVVAPRTTGFLSGGSRRYTVSVVVPTASALALKTGSADTRALGEYGATWATTGSGDLSVELVSGPLEVQAGSGDLSFAELRGEGRIKSGSGDVRVGRVGAALTLSTGSGDVAVDSVAGSLAVKTGSGDVRVGESTDDVSFSTGSGDLQVGVARRGRFTVKGASGDVRLGIPAGTPVWTDITTVTGSIHSDLGGTGEPAEGQDHVEVRAQVATGDITLQQR
jgi:DUF4097 and DUF4098 domain-containing protein YvlB